MRDWPPEVGRKVRPLVETKVSQIAPGRNSTFLIGVEAEGPVVAAPGAVAHEGASGEAVFLVFVELGVEIIGGEGLVGGFHLVLKLEVAAGVAVSGHIEEEGAVGSFGGEGVVDEFFGVTDVCSRSSE